MKNCNFIIVTDLGFENTIRLYDVKENGGAIAIDLAASSPEVKTQWLEAFLDKGVMIEGFPLQSLPKLPVLNSFNIVLVSRLV
jgi:hypothetical protein